MREVSNRVLEMLENMEHGYQIELLFFFKLGKREDGNRNAQLRTTVLGVRFIGLSAFRSISSAFEKVDEFTATGTCIQASCILGNEILYSFIPFESYKTCSINVLRFGAMNSFVGFPVFSLVEFLGVFKGNGINEN